MSAPLRADNIDDALVKAGTKLVQHCRDRGYRAVGTLKFRVKFGKEAARLDVEPLCSNLADRLENLLLLAGGSEEVQALAVLHRAGPAAFLRDRTATYATPQGREQLFEATYPLAWGSKKQKPDAFLTGQAEFSADLKQVTVVIEEITRKRPPAGILTLTVATDRPLLGDPGLFFALPLSRAKTVASPKLDALAVEAAHRKRQEKGSSDHLEAGKLAELAVLADGPLDIRPDRLPGQGMATVPQDRQSLHLQVKNTCGQQLGLVLRFAGLGTLDESVEGPVKSRQWIIDAGKSYIIKGYYHERQRLPAGFAAPRAEPGGLGVGGQDLVELFVLADGPRPSDAAYTQQRHVSLRGLSPRERAALREKSYARVRSAVAARAGVQFHVSTVKDPKTGKETKRELIVPDAWPRTADLKLAGLRNATLIEYRRVRLEVGK